MQLIVDTLVPAVLLFLMFVIGLELTREDFRRLAETPGTILAAVVGQIILLPAIAVGLVWAAGLESEAAAGMVILAACPAGAISNFYVYLAGANVALSVTLTAISSLLSFVTLPLTIKTIFELLLGRIEEVDFSVGPLAMQLFGLVVLPLATGIAVRANWSAFARRRRLLLRRLGTIALMVLLVIVLFQGGLAFLLQFPLDLFLALVFTVLAMSAGLLVAMVIGASPADSMTLSIEFAVRNLAAATFFAVIALGGVEFVFFAAGVFLIQAPVMMLLAKLFRRHRLSPRG